MELSKRTELMPGVFLTLVKTDKFKTSFLGASMLSTLSAENAPYFAVLPYVLRRGCSRYPDMQSLSAALDSLYGARLEPVVRKKGDAQCSGFVASVIDDKFAPGNNLLMETAQLLGECLLSPNLENGLFKEEYVAGERSNLIDRIRAMINDKRVYAKNRLTELMCADEPYGISELGSEEKAAAIDNKSLYEFYSKALSESRFELFFCGSKGHEQAKETLSKVFSRLPRAGAITPVSNGIKQRAGKMRSVEESMDVTQGKLSIGFRTGIDAHDKTLPAMMMTNAVFGGTSTSKLFMNVRERLSLCYYASSSLDRLKGVMNVYSGIEFDKFEVARDEIFGQLEACRRGEIEPWEIEGARSVLKGALRSYLDSQSMLEDFYLAQSVGGLKLSPEDLASMLDGVALEDIVSCAKKIEPDTVYFLKGQEQGAAGNDK